MPHSTTIARHSTISVWESLWPNGDSIANYGTTLEEVVAKVFKAYTGEILEPGTHSLAYAPVYDDTAPASLVIMVAAWWSEERAGKFEAMERIIEKDVRSWHPAFADAIVELNVGGGWDPRRPTENLHAMSVEDLFYEAIAISRRSGGPDRLTIHRLNNAGLRTVGQIIQRSPDEIKRQTQVQWKGLRNLVWSLKQLNLALRRNDIGGPRAPQLVSTGGLPPIPGPEPY